MLAKTTLRDRALSATELRISEEEREALLWFHEQNIIHSPNPYSTRLKKGLTFNMDIVAIERHCGTVCCIAGWVAYKLDRPAHNYYENARISLTSLYYPSPGNLDWNKLRPDQAKLAVELFLCGNRDPWPEALELLP